MRGFDFAPLYRATVGFDQIADMMDRVLTNDVSQPSYPLTISKKPLTTPIAFRLPSPVSRTKI